MPVTLTTGWFGIDTNILQVLVVPNLSAPSLEAPNLFCGSITAIAANDDHGPNQAPFNSTD